MDIAGFTGTQCGMTDEQKEFVYQMLKNSVQLHHGDCIGADADAHTIGRELHKLQIRIHPPIKDYKRAFCNADVEYPKKDYLVRNKNIVNTCTFLLACPGEKEEQLRSGTWSTIRYARKKKVYTVIVYPDGTISTT